MSSEQMERELLELAAKAARLSDAWPVPHYEIQWNGSGLYCSGGGKGVLWNPLTDDGDALRLAVKLGIDLSLYAEKGGRVYAQTKHVLGFGRDGEPSYQAHGYMDEPYGSDPCAATRRAIVRAAAQLAKGAEK